MNERLNHQLLEEGMLIAKKVFFVYSNRKVEQIPVSRTPYCFGLDVKQNEQGDLYTLNQPFSEGELNKTHPLIQSIFSIFQLTFSYEKHYLTPTGCIQESVDSGLISPHKSIFIDRNSCLEGVTIDDILKVNPEITISNKHFFKVTKKGHKKFVIQGDSANSGGKRIEDEVITPYLEPAYGRIYNT